MPVWCNVGSFLFRHSVQVDPVVRQGSTLSVHLHVPVVSPRTTCRGRRRPSYVPTGCTFVFCITLVLQLPNSDELQSSLSCLMLQDRRWASVDRDRASRSPLSRTGIRASNDPSITIRVVPSAVARDHDERTAREEES